MSTDGSLHDTFTFTKNYSKRNGCELFILFFLGITRFALIIGEKEVMNHTQLISCKSSGKVAQN